MNNKYLPAKYNMPQKSYAFHATLSKSKFEIVSELFKYNNYTKTKNKYS